MAGQEPEATNLLLTQLAHASVIGQNSDIDQIKNSMESRKIESEQKRQEKERYISICIHYIFFGEKYTYNSIFHTH